MKKEKNYSLFSKEYESLFKENLNEFSKNMVNEKESIYSKQNYSLFFPSCGSSHKKDIKFMIYGQATTGWWDPHFKIKNIHEGLISKAKEESNPTDPGEGEMSPLDWVNKRWYKPGYRLSNFFWPVTYMFINSYINDKKQVSLKEFRKLYYNDNSWINNDEWCKTLVWSNLIKIAPKKDYKSSPNFLEIVSQKEYSKKLFLQEIKEIKPEIILLMTNWKNWAEYFLEDKKFHMKKIKSKNGYVLFTGKIGQTKIIVTKRERVERSVEKWWKCINDILEFS